MEKSQTHKAEALENAVINDSPQELERLMKELGSVEFSARALGTACRFRGYETVKALTENGASFNIPKTEEAEKRYCCYAGINYDNYRSNFSLCLLNISCKIKGACCFKGVKLTKQIKRENNPFLKLLPDEERLRVLKYLCENKDKLSFDPSEMLYYAIAGGDELVAAELKKSGITLSSRRIKAITEGGAYTDGYWYEHLKITAGLPASDYLHIMEQIAVELDGKPFHYTDKVYEITKSRFSDIRAFKFFIDNFKREKMNKYQIVKDLITAGNIEALPVIEEMGWLSVPKKRDELIEFASDTGSPEAVSWLLDFKNRTADFAAEREKAEKKMLAELNASPDSVTALKKLWSYKKGEDGGLVITNYKGSDTEVTVPEKIGKSSVTAIGRGAFAGSSGLCAGIVTSYASYEQMRNHRNIKKITLPQGIKIIDTGAFADTLALKEINIPETVEEIKEAAFYQAVSIKSLTLPQSVKKIGAYAFAHCKNLACVKIYGAEEIGAGAFRDTKSLKTLELPASLKRMLSNHAENVNLNAEPMGLFSSVTVRCPKGSYAEEYCKKQAIKYEYSEEKAKKPKEIFKFKKTDNGYAVSEYILRHDETVHYAEIPSEYKGLPVKEIGDAAFILVRHLSEIAIPEGIRKIGANAFSFSGIKSVSLPKSLKIIDTDAFSCCDELEQVLFQSSDVKFGFSVFDGCPKLKAENIMQGLSRSWDITKPFVPENACRDKSMISSGGNSPFSDDEESEITVKEVQFDWDGAMREDVFELAMKYDSFSRFNKGTVLEEAVKRNMSDSLPLAEAAGWKLTRGDIDRLLNISLDNGFVEITAWLLDYKNRRLKKIGNRKR